MTITTGRSFGMALCDHFNLPHSQMMSDLRMNADKDDVFSVTMTIALTADDLAAIALHMTKRADRSAIPVIPMPSPGR